jgi:hypothetical protein
LTEFEVAWAKAGIVGRGVLLDYPSYAARNGIKINPLDHYAVSLKVAKEMAKECGFEFQAGDIILLRTGINVPKSYALYRM